VEITSRQAAERLGVTQQRIQALFAAGDVRGQMVAGRLLVESADIQARLARRPGRGRPLAARVAWGMIWELSGERAHWLAASERSRLRTSIRKLNTDQVVLRARRRASLHQYRILPTYVNRLAADAECVASGVGAASAVGADIVAISFAEVYTTRSTHDRLVKAYVMVQAGNDGDINVNLRVLDDDLAFLLSGRARMPSAVVACDLLESPEPRSRRAGSLVLSDLLSRF
jgi:hypothetical protein